jgi:hypothetical protein
LISLLVTQEAKISAQTIAASVEPIIPVVPRPGAVALANVIGLDVSPVTKLDIFIAVINMNTVVKAIIQ